jgi:processive 1,2-diacylglycerol beta-glucosyltransferase
MGPGKPFPQDQETPVAIPNVAPLARRRGRAARAARPAAAVRRVLIVSGSVGAGHDGAARELAERLRARGVEVDVRDFLEAVPRWAASVLRDGYSTSVDKVPFVFELLFQRTELRGPVWRGMRWITGLGNRTVTRWFREGGYDLVVSTYPMSTQCIGGLRERGVIDVPVVTYLTDPAAHRSWVHPAVDHHVTVTQATADHGLADYGVPMVAGGPLVPARFTRPVPAAELERAAAELDLPAGRPVALLVAGSLGIGDVLTTVRDVAGSGVLPLVLCGRNEGLRRRVAAVPGAVALGWRTDVHVLMQLADVLVHNAGGLSFTEALVAGLPAVTYRAIPGHGRANAAVLDDAGLAPWVRTPEELPAVLARQAAEGHRPAALGDPTDTVVSLLPPVELATSA